jgi:hypothetical protein
MRKLQLTNMQFNQKQIETRGEASESYVVHPIAPVFQNTFNNSVKKELFTKRNAPALSRKPETLQQHH